MAGKFVKGALVEFMPSFLIPQPKVIAFQYNPETMSHTWSQPEPASSGKDQGSSNPLAVSGLPGETFSFTIMMDANDTIADGTEKSAELAQEKGLYPRLAALEKLLYPTAAFGPALVGSVSASASLGSEGLSVDISASIGVKSAVPQMELPTVLFVWGSGRILPVRVTGLTVTEKLYDEHLNPTHADAQLALRVLTEGELNSLTYSLADIAKTAYKYSQDLRQNLALDKFANAAEPILGMLPV
jgi:hypothetical protein